MNNEKELTYEEAVRKEFEQTQTPVEETKVTNLGKVNLNKVTTADIVNDDPNIQRINATIGYLDVPLDTLPSGGRFYPENTKISIRAARVGEVREFSTIDETNGRSIMDKLTYMISQCVRVYYGNVPGHYKDLVNADKIVLILKIRELTFVDGQSSIKIPIPAGACKTPGCTPQSDIYFDSTKLRFQPLSEKLEKYYDPVERCYKVATKDFGIINLYVPTIGVIDAIANYIEEQARKRQKIDESLVDMLQYLIKDWRGLSDRMIFAKISELSGWDTKKFTLVYRLIEEITVGIEYEIVDTCERCGGEIVVPITFPNGYKSLFVPTVDDLGEELL